jgi:tetratricopeptide (TPR) repeat protein
VTSFDNRTGESRFDGMLEHALAHALSDSTYLNVVPRERIDDALRLMTRPTSTVVDADVGREIALRDGAIRAVVGGRFERVGGVYVLTARLIDPRDGAIADSRREEADTDAALAPAVRRLSDWTRDALGERRPVEQGQPTTPKVTTSSLRALRLYAEGEAAARAAHLSGQWTEAESLLASAVAEDPEFASAHIWLAWAQSNHNAASGGSAHDSHLVAASRAMQMIDRTTPRERYFIRGSYFWLTNQHESAVGEFEALVRLYPDDYWGLTKLSPLYGSVGRSHAVVEMNARLAGLRPNDPHLRVRVTQDVLQIEGLNAARPHAAAAARLIDAVPRNVRFPRPVRTYAHLFQAHELWLQGRVHEAAAVVEAVAAKPEIAAEGVNGQQVVDSFYFTLGRLRRIEETWAQGRNQYPTIQKNQRALMALTRNEPGRVRALVGSYEGADAGAVRLLIRAGELEAAADVLKRITAFWPLMVERATAELEAARGDPRSLEQLVRAESRSVRQSAWFYSLAYLAEAHVARHDLPRAIEVLEAASAEREKVYYAAHSGAAWIESQKMLADLYRKTGRPELARSIEGDLLALLAAADQDHPLLVELKNRRPD